MKGKLREIRSERKEMGDKITRYHSLEDFRKAIDSTKRSVRDGLRVYVKMRFTGRKTGRGRIVKGRLDPKTFGEPELVGPLDVNDYVEEFKWGEIAEELPTINKNFYHGQIYDLRGTAKLLYLRDE